jgi:hypothetical protein
MYCRRMQQGASEYDILSMKDLNYTEDILEEIENK